MAEPIEIGSIWHRRGKSSRYTAWVIKLWEGRIYLHSGSGVWRLTYDKFLDDYERVF